MKSAIGGALMVIGLLVLVGSAFIGQQVDADEEWTEQQQEEFSQLSTSIHVPRRNRDAEETQKQVERLKAMQQELIDAKSTRDSRRSSMKIAGFSIIVVGLGIQFWAWADQRKE